MDEPDERPPSLQLRAVAAQLEAAADRTEEAVDRAEAESQELATELAEERTAHQETLAALKRLRPWADAYEDNMGTPEFAARAEGIRDGIRAARHSTAREEVLVRRVLAEHGRGDV